MPTPRFLTAIAALGLAAAAMTGAGPGARAQAVTCGQDYTVQTGDTLSRIAQRAYGSVSSYQIIYSANTEVIGPNPGIIRLGSVLRIPCLDGETTPSTADAAVIRPVETTGALPAPEDRVIRVLTATDWAPFLDEDQEQGGMLTEITNVALSRADGSPRFKIDFINDWGAHLQPLLSDHAYDLGIAWFRPNCDVIEKLGDGSKFRCNNLDWSEPLFEQIIGYYTRADFPAPADHAALFGAKLCRPAGYSTFMLEEKDLVAPNVTFIAPAGPDEAFGMLLDGGCDVVVIATDVAQVSIDRLDAADRVAVQSDLAQVATLHAVISKTHPRGREILAALDSGLRDIKADATWFSIVQRHLAEHRARTGGD